MTHDTVLTIRIGSINIKLKRVIPEECLEPHFLQVILKESKNNLTHNKKTK